MLPDRVSFTKWKRWIAAWYDLNTPCLYSIWGFITIIINLTLIYSLHWILDLLWKCKDLRKGQLGLHLGSYRTGDKPGYPTFTVLHNKFKWEKKILRAKIKSRKRRMADRREEKVHLHFILLITGSREVDYVITSLYTTSQYLTVKGR